MGFGRQLTQRMGARTLALMTAGVALPAIANAQATATSTPVASPAPLVDACDRRWVERVVSQTRPSIVKVESVAGLGTGFVFGDPRHVVTALHVVESGRPLDVVFFDNAGQVSARVVAFDREHDLALLELDAPAPGAPLVAETEAIDIGAEVIAIGHPMSGLGGGARQMSGLLDWSVSRGIVSAKNEAFIQTDASINPGNSGGPMLDCTGHVVGIVSWKIASEAVDNISFIVHANHLAALYRRPRGYYLGRTLGTGGIMLMAQFGSTQPYYGLALALGTRWFDRADLTLRGGYLWGVYPDDPDPVLYDTRRRWMVQGDLRARFAVARGRYIHAGAGVSWFHDLLVMRRFEIATDAADPKGHIDSRRIRQSQGYFRPLATVSYAMGGVELGYTLVLDAGDFGDSTHQLSIVIGN